jgi:uncharacterized protein YjiS (DUF1127 family)
MRTATSTHTLMRPKSSSFLVRMNIKVVGWWNRAASRSELTSLDEHDLRDIGMTSSGAQFEADKPFWCD